MPGSWPLLVALALAGFLIGSVNPATIVANRHSGDLTLGSGNPGATNIGRLLGVRLGVLVGVLDVLKGLLPTLVVLVLADRSAAYVVGLTAVLGHMFSPFLGGHGGKGVATASGVLLGALPLVALAGIAAFVLVLWAARWVALSSMVACLVLAVAAFAVPIPEPVWLGRAWVCSIAVLVLARHHRNIRAWWAHHRHRRA